MQSILLLIYPHESVIYTIFYTAVYGAFYGYCKRTFHRVFFKTSYGVLRRYHRQGVFCKLVCTVLQMIFYKAYKGHIM